MGVDKPNYTQIPNLLLDDLMMYMDEAELKVTLAIARHTFGFHRERIRLSLSALQTLTGLSRPTVVKGIQAGIERGTIERYEIDGSFEYALAINGAPPVPSKETLLVKEINQDASKETLPGLVNNLNQTSKDSLPELVNNLYQNTPTLKKVLKKVLKKEERKGERAQRPRPPKKPTRLRSRNASRGNAINFKSPHVDKSHFDLDTGYIRPGSGTTAVEIFYERFDVCNNEQRLTPPMEDDMMRLFPDLEKLREVIIAFNRAGFKNQRNLQLILDWYQKGIPDKHNQMSASKPTVKAATGLDAVDEYEILKKKHGVTS